jgi:arylsulfatase A-like enzyme
MRTVVIAAHGCPVWPLGAYGNEWIATPHLDRLAAEGVTFDRHFAHHPDPLGGRADWWGVKNPSPPTPPPEGERRVIIRATRRGFDAPSHYYARFAEVFDARPQMGRPPFAPLLELLPQVLDTLGDDALVWVETDRLMPPWFAPPDVFEVYCEDLTDDAGEDADPLQPWGDPQVGWFDRDDLASWELLHRSFAATLTTFDADLGRIFEVLTAKRWDESANWVFTSDFGFPLGHHGLLGPHRPWLHEEFVHLPLIVRRPGGGEGERVWAFTQPDDVLPLVTGENTPNATRSQVISVCEIDGHREAALRTDTHAILLPLGTPEDEPREPLLYEKPSDRWELNDVRQPNLGLADEMEAELRRQLGLG